MSINDEEIQTREKILRKITEPGCRNCNFLEQLKKELNKEGFLSFNRNVQLWKITYVNGIINLSPCTSF